MCSLSNADLLELGIEDAGVVKIVMLHVRCDVLQNVEMLLTVCNECMRRVAAHHLGSCTSVGSATAADEPSRRRAAASISGEQATKVSQSCACMHGCCRKERSDQGMTSSLNGHCSLCMYRRRRLPACGVQAGCSAAVQQLTLAVPAVSGSELSPAISLGPPQQRRSGGKGSGSSCNLQFECRVHLGRCQSPSSSRISGSISHAVQRHGSTCAGPRSTTLVELAAAARACTAADRRPEGAPAPPCCRAAEQRLFDSLHPPATAVSQAASQCGVPSAARQWGPQEAGTCSMLVAQSGYI